MPPITFTRRIDAATSRRAWTWASLIQEDVQQIGSSLNGQNGTIDTFCKFGTSTQTSHSTITFTGSDAFHVETHSHFDPPLSGKSERTTIADSKWLGRAPPK